jgi:muramoyltetrapeptide carboxypeptidase LdcA involved in peptidoglycan recycling
VDWPFGNNDLYKKIDKQIPKSKFILTIREKESHKKSLMNYFKNAPDGDQILKEIDTGMENIEKRNKEVRNYFNYDKSKLLVVNIIGGDGWEKLCKFLNKPVPNRPFPHKNIGKYKK